MKSTGIQDSYNNVPEHIFGGLRNFFYLLEETIRKSTCYKNVREIEIRFFQKAYVYALEVYFFGDVPDVSGGQKTYLYKITENISIVEYEMAINRTEDINLLDRVIIDAILDKIETGKVDAI